MRAEMMPRSKGALHAHQNRRRATLTEYGGRNKGATSQMLLSSLMQDVETLRSCIQVAEAKGYKSWHLGAALERGLSRAQHRGFGSRRANHGRFSDQRAVGMVMTPFGKRRQLCGRFQSGEVDRMLRFIDKIDSEGRSK